MSQPDYIPVVWPRPGTPVRGYILCQRPEGCWTHPIFDGSKIRTMPCIGREHGCSACGPHTRLRWQGYCPILDHRTGRVHLAQLTKEAARQCPPLHDPRRQLRGMFLELTRVGASKSSLVKAEVQTVEVPAYLPKPPNVQQALLRLWGLLPHMTLIGEEEGEVPNES